MFEAKNSFHVLRDPAERGRHPNTFPDPIVRVGYLFLLERENPSRRDIRVLERDRAR